VRVTHGPEQLSYRELSSSERKLATMRSIVVDLPTADHSVLPTSNKELKKKLLKLKPSEYFERSSDPKTDLRIRAVLQFLRQKMYYIHILCESSVKRMTHGQKPFGFRMLHRLKQCFKRRDKWSLYDHLLYRYTLWGIDRVVLTKSRLEAIGLDSDDLCNPLIKDYTRLGPLRPTSLFVKDKEYTKHG